jgi:hypothetical protein
MVRLARCAPNGVLSETTASAGRSKSFGLLDVKSKSPKVISKNGSADVVSLGKYRVKRLSRVR